MKFIYSCFPYSIERSSAKPTPEFQISMPKLHSMGAGAMTIMPSGYLCSAFGSARFFLQV